MAVPPINPLSRLTRTLQLMTTRTEGLVGIGAVARDFDATVLFSIQKRVVMKWQPDVAEARQLQWQREAINVIQELNFQQLILESDSLDLMNALSVEIPILSAC
ncbi:conserved hypothetical protein [Ricinus communis]|uniref:RNase H type-1 domain-containing protein n=1 Tax=Ricinus communis TaxID=3988 RepID=B9SA02_RICCO|nr:conserved hypothetical protein [Ricinus communis]